MEDFGYKKDESQSSLTGLAKKIFLAAATIFSIICFIYLTIHAYYFVYNDKDSDIEVIKAPDGPIKVMEDQKNSVRDAAQIDNSIYEDIFGNKGTKRENPANFKIVDIPEPVSPPAVSREEITTDDKIVKEVLEESHAAEKKVKIPDQQQKIIVFSNALQKEAPAQDLLTKNSGKEKALTGKTTNQDQDKEIDDLPRKNKKRAARVQIAAMTSKNATEQYWIKLNKSYPDLLSGLKSYVQKVDMGKKGFFYRLQIGNFFNQIEAEEFCRRYVIRAQKSKADCIIVE
jgi:hypothetical protein